MAFNSEYLFFISPFNRRLPDFSNKVIMFHYSECFGTAACNFTHVVTFCAKCGTTQNRSPTLLNGTCHVPFCSLERTVCTLPKAQSQQ